MHEAGLLAAAIADALAAGGPAGAAGPGTSGARRPVAMEIRIHDPIHVAPEAARVHAEIALRSRGLDGVEIEVTADPVVCILCGVSNEARSDHPFCADCGWPLPDQGGHAVVATMRWAPA